MNSKLNTCCLCGAEFEGYGNNPAPLTKTGRCCDVCNMAKAIPARVEFVREFAEAKKAAGPGTK